MYYWAQRNQSKTYSKKLFRLFQNAATLISQYPGIGTPTNLGKVRSKVVLEYLVFYEEVKDAIHILAIWDTRQDPNKMAEQIT
nr:type II toxin-antitoxin system RelE/ParE family toxin [Rufibacter sp. LB8]